MRKLFRVIQSDTIQHHGIQGQKWGVKNGPPYPLDEKDHSAAEKKAENDKFHLTDNQKKMLKILVATAAVTGLSIAAYQVFKHTSITEIAKEVPKAKDMLSLERKAKVIMNDVVHDTDIILSKGTEIHRVVGNENYDISKVNDPIYASYTKLDQITYRYGLFDWSKTGKRFEVSLESTNDLRGPSEETARKIFEKLYNNNDEYRIGLADAVANRYVRAWRRHGSFSMVNDEQLYEKAYRKALEDIERHPFESGMSNLVTKTHKSVTTDMLINEFIKRGYDFVEDYMDKGKLATNPIILLNNKDIVQKGIKAVNFKSIGNRQAAKNILLKAKHPGAYGWSVEHW